MLEAIAASRALPGSPPTTHGAGGDRGESRLTRTTSCHARRRRRSRRLASYEDHQLPRRAPEAIAASRVLRGPPAATHGAGGDRGDSRPTRTTSCHARRRRRSRRVASYEDHQLPLTAPEAIAATRVLRGPRAATHGAGGD